MGEKNGKSTQLNLELLASKINSFFWVNTVLIFRLGLFFKPMFSPNWLFLVFCTPLRISNRMLISLTCFLSQSVLQSSSSMLAITVNGKEWRWEVPRLSFQRLHCSPRSPSALPTFNEQSKSLRSREAMRDGPCKSGKRMRRTRCQRCLKGWFGILGFQDRLHRGRDPWEAGLKVCIGVNFELGGPLMDGLGCARSLEDWDWRVKVLWGFLPCIDWEPFVHLWKPLHLPPPPACLWVGCMLGCDLWDVSLSSTTSSAHAWGQPI